MAKKQPLNNPDNINNDLDNQNEQPSVEKKDETEVSEDPKDKDGSEINEFKEYEIIILKNDKWVVEGEEMTVSGNVAKALIKKGLASLK